MQKNKEFLGTAPIGKLLFKLSLPTVMAQMINMLYNIVDRIYIDNVDPNYLFPFGTPEAVSAEVKKLAEPVADVIAVSFTAVLFVIQFKKAMKKLERPLEA